MAQVSQTAVGYRGPSVSAGSFRSQWLFYGCFASLVATSFGFIVRAMLLNEFGTTFNLSEAQKGAIQGAGLFPFAISIILFSLFIDKLGYGKTMVFAWLGHMGSTILMIFAKNYEMLYAATLILALANGAVEAVINPVTATLFPTKKTHYLNILHAGWPGGMMLGGAITLLMGAHFSWQWKVGLVFIPTIIYGIMLFGQRFPVQERVAAGVSYADMMREFGAAGCALVMYFLTWALLTICTVFLPEQTINSQAFTSMSTWLPPGLAIASAILFFGAYRSLGRPMFVFLLLVMILLATTELGVDSWVTDLMTPAFGRAAGWIIVYTSVIMFVLRFCAGPIVHRISPLGLLACCAAVAACGLFFLSSVGSAVALVIIAATMYGIGKAFFWPTTLGVVSEQFPRGGALTLNAMGGMGMIAVGVLGGPLLGARVDAKLDRHTQQLSQAFFGIVAEPEKRDFMMTRHPLNKDLIGAFETLKKAEKTPPATAEEREALEKANKILVDKKVTPEQLAIGLQYIDEFDKVQGQTKQGTLAEFAVLPSIMFICYVGLILYFLSKGGYKVQVLAGRADDEKFTGGVPGPIEG